jgi:hypothetical protein
MAFFQNSNTSTYPLLPNPAPNGNDEIDATICNWASFLTNAKHDERRTAFQELAFLLCYYRNRKFGIRNLPFVHNELYNKVFKYFVECDPNDIPFSQTLIIGGITTPVNPIFNIVMTPGPGAVMNYHIIKNALPILKSINGTDKDIDNSVLRAIQNDITLGFTTMGFFAEAVLLFSNYFLIRQLTKLNGYDWTYNVDIDLNPSGKIFDKKANRITFLINNANKKILDSPYFFNGLLDKIRPLGYNVPVRPVIGLATVGLEQIVMLLDPNRPIGKPTPGMAGWGLILPLVPSTFIQDAYTLISNRVLFPTPGALTNPQILNQIQILYEEINKYINETIQDECNFMMKLLLPNIDENKLKSNSILASGIGSTSISILNQQDFGLSFFNYSMVSSIPKTARVLDSLHYQPTSPNNSIDISKTNIIHFGVYALDHPTTESDLSVKVISLKSTLTFSAFEFKLDPTTSKISPVLVPKTISSVFYNTTTSSQTEFFETIIDINGLSIDVLVATFHSDNKELIFSSFNSGTCALYGITNTNKLLKFYIKSGMGSGVYEELQTSISVFELQSINPPIIIDNVVFANDTFQLYDSNTSSGTSYDVINRSSYNRILFDPSQKYQVKKIFELLKKDSGLSVTNQKTKLRPPLLEGGYIGKLVTTLLPDSSIVEGDSLWKPKYTGVGTKTERLPVGTSEERIFPLLRYSFAKIEILPSATVTNGNEISISIISYVSPSPSSLNSFIPTIARVTYSNIRNGGSNNQVLAMLRSFGLLEAIVERMLELLNDAPIGTYSNPEKSYITSAIREWFPTASLTLVCKDQQPTGSPTPTVLANDINRDEYESLKIW